MGPPGVEPLGISRALLGEKRKCGGYFLPYQPCFIHPTPPRKTNSPLALGKPQVFWALFPLHGLRRLVGFEVWDRGRGVSGCTVREINLTTVRYSHITASLRPPIFLEAASGEGKAGQQRDLRTEKSMSILMAEHSGATEPQGEPELIPSYSQQSSPCRVCFWGSQFCFS